MERMANVVKARIGVYCGGKYGRNGEYIALIEPKYFKNGNMKMSDFKVIEIIQVVKKWYAFRTATVRESIKEIM